MPDRKGKARDTAIDAAALSEWNNKQWVWVPDAKAGYLAGWVVKDENGQSTVALESGEGMRQVPSLELCRLNPPSFEGAEDIADLTYLNEASVVHNLRSRYTENSIYTYSGLFLVAVNPYRSLPIYSAATIESYKNKRRDQNPPHVYAVAEKAWQNMIAHRDQSQSVLVTGESGAGKTENTKKVIQYLAAIAADPLPSSSSYDLLARQAAADSRLVDPSVGKKLGQLEKQILEANPILESFGNAQTVKNNNSSRFGKFVRIFFNSVGAIAGANIDWYLLEKSRVTARSVHERTFHVFFQLLQGADAQMKKQLLLTDSLNDYAYTMNGRQVVEGIDDKSEFSALVSALSVVGFNSAEQLNLFKVIAAILQLGNISVTGNDSAHISDRSALGKACFLLGLDETEFVAALVRPKVKAGREWVTQARTSKQVLDEIAALSKTLYEKNFGCLVEKINSSLGRPSTKTFIGVLDIAGFEIFETNGFDQLCINLTNEKLQQFFNHHMFVLEQEEYEREKIDWEFVNFGLELQPTIDLIENTNPMGILSCLDDASIMPKATDKTFTDKLNQLAGEKPIATQFTKYSASRIEQGFTVSHYAGKVEYRTEGWLEKNRDPLNENLTSLLAKSRDGYVSNMFAEYAETETSIVLDSVPRTRVRKGAFRTVGQRHKEQLNFLISQLNETQPHFVRCIVPNLTKSPGEIQVPLVLDQLRCNGVLEGIRIARLGFPNRLPFSEFRRRFELLAENPFKRGNFIEGSAACEMILDNLSLDPSAYRIGLSKIFFKAGILAELEQRRDAVLANILTRLQATARKFIVRRQANRILNRAQAVRTVQRNARLYIQLKNWPWWTLFQRVRPLLAAARSDDEMRRKEEELARAKELAEREVAEKEKLKQIRYELESVQMNLQQNLNEERNLNAEKDSALRQSKERESSLQESLSVAEQEVERIQAELRLASSGKLDAERRVGELNAAYANQIKLLETLKQDQTRWKLKEKALELKTLVDSKEWENLVASKQDLLKNLQELKRKSSEAGQDFARELKKNESEKERLEQRLQIESSESKSAMKKMVQLETAAKLAKEDFVKLSAAKSDLELNLKTKENELNRVTSEQNKLVREKDSLTARLTTLESELASTTKQLQSAKSELDNSKINATKAAADLVTMRKLLDDHSSDQQRTAELNKMKEAEVQTLKSQLSKITVELDLARRDSSLEIANLKTEKEKTLAQISDLKLSESDLSRQLKLLTSKIETLTMTNEKLSQSDQTHQLEIELLRTKSAETLLKAREEFERELNSIRSQFNSLEAAAISAQREQASAERKAQEFENLLQTEQTRVQELLRIKERLDEQISDQFAVLADQDRIHANLRSETTVLKSRLAVAEEKAGRTVVEHIRVLEEAQRLQNNEMERMRAKEDERTAYVKTLERARTSLTQSLEDLQHERETERWLAFINKTGPNTKENPLSKIQDALDKEIKLRQLAELNITRLQSEIKQQQEQLTSSNRENVELRRTNAQIERELNSVAASDPSESLVYPAPRSESQRWSLRESRVANTLPNYGGAPRTPPVQKVQIPSALPASPRRKYYE